MGVDLDLGALISELRDDLGYRRIRQGLRKLEAVVPQLDRLSPDDCCAGLFTGLVAQWVDAGLDGPPLLARLLARFPPRRRSHLPLLDYLHLRMAEGVIAMSQEEFDRAAAHFRFVQSLEHEIDDGELLAIANFWTGRCLRRIGQYDDALAYTQRGEEFALRCGYTPMAAVMQTTRSWVAFQKGRFSEALALLRRAAEALSQTDDYVNRGNIYSAHGRIARRQGRYDYAVECFDRAISEYRQTETAHLQLGRTLLNLAFVKRLLALDRQKQSDRVAASRRLRKIEGAETVELLQDRRASIESIRAEARAHLDESLAVYGPRNNHRGIAGVHINSGFLRLDAGDLERAAADAAEAFRHGEEKHDHIIMARARTLQCIIENAAVEEQLDDPSRHLDAAESHASDAVHYAGHTQNRRLLARAYVWQGLTFAAHSPPNLEAARNCCEQALALLHTEGAEKQKVWDDLEALRARVLRGTPIDPVLRAWCSGVTGDKPFQQLEEEFARIVIPKVWEREGRKVSRVAEKLSISPKKVRRILYAAGLLGASSADGAE